MAKTYKILVLAGSLRREAYSRKLAVLLAKNAPANLSFTPADIADLPLYNEDLEAQTPPAWARLRREIAAADGVIFITPEYNRSIPAALKNALDIGSRPYGRNVWNGRPALAVSLSQGPMGGYGANQHLRQVLAVLNMPAMPQPEAYIGKVQELVNQADDPANQKFLQGLMQGFAVWLDKQLS